MVETTVPKKGRGRPKTLFPFNSVSDTDGAAAQLAEAETAESIAPAAAADAVDYSRAYQTFSNAQSAAFQRFTEGYPDRRAISCYVWRMDPPIDRRQVGLTDTNIEIIPGSVDLEALLDKHGSGEYHLKFNDSNAKPAQRAKCTVRLDDPQKPPNLNPLELLIDGTKGMRNSALVAKYVNLGWSVVTKKNELMPDGFRGLEPPPAASVVSDARAASVDASLVGLVREAYASQRSQGSEIDRAFQIFDRLKPPAPAALDPVAQFVNMAKVFKELQVPAAAPPAALDPLETFKKTAEALTTMGWSAPGAGGGGGGGWVEGLAVLPSLFQHASTFLTQLVAFKMAGGGVLGAVPLVAPVLAAPVLAAPAPAGVEGETVVNPLVLMEVGQAALASMESGEPGDDFASRIWNNPRYHDTYDLVAGLGKVGIFGYLNSNPAVAARLAPRQAEVNNWVDRFLAFGQPEPAAGEPAAGEPAAGVKPAA